MLVPRTYFSRSEADLTCVISTLKYFVLNLSAARSDPGKGHKHCNSSLDAMNCYLIIELKGHAKTIGSARLPAFGA